MTSQEFINNVRALQAAETYCIKFKLQSGSQIVLAHSDQSTGKLMLCSEDLVPVQIQIRINF